MIFFWTQIYTLSVNMVSDQQVLLSMTNLHSWVPWDDSVLIMSLCLDHCEIVFTTVIRTSFYFSFGNTSFSIKTISFFFWLAQTNWSSTVLPPRLLTQTWKWVLKSFGNSEFYLQGDYPSVVFKMKTKLNSECADLSECISRSLNPNWSNKNFELLICAAVS